MNVFHEVTAHTNYGHFPALVITLSAITLLLLLASIVLVVRKSAWSGLVIGSVFVVAFVGGLGCFAGGLGIRENANVNAHGQTQQNLISWVHSNYQAKLTSSSARTLWYGEPVAIRYHNKPTVVQLIQYENGYILVNNTNQKPLTQEGK